MLLNPCSPKLILQLGWDFPLGRTLRNRDSTSLLSYHLSITMEGMERTNLAPLQPLPCVQRAGEGMQMNWTEQNHAGHAGLKTGSHEG